MTKKFTKLDMFQELSVILARIEDKLDKVADLENRVKVLEAELQTRLNQKYSQEVDPSYWVPDPPLKSFKVPEQKCYFDSLSPEDRMKPMGISCPCKRCSPHSMSGGSIESQTKDVWINIDLDRLK